MTDGVFDREIWTRFLDSSGQPTGGEFQVNSYTEVKQEYPSITQLEDETIAIAWDDSDAMSVRRISTAGLPIGSETRLQASDGGSSDVETQTSIAPAVGGGFLVAWDCSSDCLGTSQPRTVVGQLFDAGDTTVGSPFVIPEDLGTTGSQARSSIASLGSNGFIVIWRHFRLDEPRVRGRRLGMNASPIGGELIFSSQGDFPTVAAAGDDEFVVAWQDLATEEDRNLSIRIQRFDTTGLPLATELELAPPQNGVDALTIPSVATNPAGDIFSSFRFGSTAARVEVGFARFDSLGDRTNFHLQINSIGQGPSTQNRHKVAAGTDSFAVVWNSDVSLSNDFDALSVQARSSFQAIFIDGFESGDTSRWFEAVSDP